MARVRRIRLALVQFDAKPERVAANRAAMERWVKEAAAGRARWVMFHEGTVCDYTPHLKRLAERVPGGATVRRMVRAARRHACWISFGLSETDGKHYYITQVFVGPEGFVYRYRKTWIWREPSDKGYRNEWARYDTGHGPELFMFDGVRATCFICADGEAPRCIERARVLKPQVVFFPNNRGGLPGHDVFGSRARAIGAPMLVTNRVGRSWVWNCQGGCVVYSARGTVLAAANRDGQEEILYHDLRVC